MIKNNIVKGFSWLVFGSLVSKALGGFYKIFLTRIIGGENLGIFNQILSIYTFFVLFVSAGLPTAMSKLIAKYDSLEHKVKCLKSVLKIFIYISIFISICLVVVSFYLSHYKGNLTIQSCYFILAPAIVFSSMTAIIKGYFQAENNFKPSAISQIVEQLIKIIIGLLFCYLFKSFGAYVQILIAVFAIASADFAIFLILYFSFKKHINFKIKGKLELKVLKQLFNIVFPIMLASLILPFSQMIDSLLVVKLLSRNFSVDASIYLYGLQSGVVATLINLPTVVTFALSSVLMPLLTRDYEKGNMEGYNKKITLAVKIIISFAVPCVIFVLFYPDKIINLLYKNKLSGYGINGEMLTSKLLFWSAMNILFLCGSQFLSICLQAQDKKYLPAFNNLMGVIIKFILVQLVTILIKN